MHGENQPQSKNGKTSKTSKTCSSIVAEPARPARSHIARFYMTTAPIVHLGEQVGPAARIILVARDALSAVLSVLPTRDTACAARILCVLQREATGDLLDRLH